MGPTTEYCICFFSAVKLKKINNQFYLKNSYTNRKCVFSAYNKWLPHLANSFFSSQLNEKYELTSNKLLQLLVKVCTSICIANNLKQIQKFHPKMHFFKPKTVVIWVKVTLFNGTTLNGRE